MKPMQMVIGAVVVLVVLALIVAAAIVPGYNRAIGLDEGVHQQWAQVETQLKRRYDMIPNLEATVKGTAAQESKVLLGIAEARKAYQNAVTVNERAAAATQLEGALSRLLVIHEAYPELKSNEAFLKLQDSLEGTENRVSVERGRYNDRVRDLNQYVRSFPGSLYAGFAGVHAATYFEVEASQKEPPKIDFSDKPEKKEEAKTEEPAK